MNPLILVVEDNEDLQEFLRDLLTENGYTVQVASDGVSALDKLDSTEPDLVLLDLTLPDMSGESICRDIRKTYPNVVVIMLTAKDEISSKVKGLQMGADDYVTKPFIADELLARIAARLRRKSDESEVLRVGDLELNTKTIEVKRGDKVIDLTPQEFKLLEYLMNNTGIVLTRDMILSRVWQYSSEVDTRVVDVYIGYLRKKIDKGFKNKLLHSVRGFGYTIKENE